MQNIWSKEIPYVREEVLHQVFLYTYKKRSWFYSNSQVIKIYNLEIVTIQSIRAKATLLMRLLFRKNFNKIFISLKQFLENKNLSINKISFWKICPKTKFYIENLLQNNYRFRKSSEEKFSYRKNAAKVCPKMIFDWKQCPETNFHMEKLSHQHFNHKSDQKNNFLYKENLPKQIFV